MSVTKDSTFAAAMPGERYKVAFQCAQSAFSVDQSIFSLFVTVL